MSGSRRGGAPELRAGIAPDDRARQFMPFAALKGYYDMVRERERVVEPRREMTEERAAALSGRVASLRKGDVVRVEFYDDGAYVRTCGVVTEVCEALRFLSVVRQRIPFDALWDVTMVESATEGVCHVR